ncbi:LOW QUALITY PROTEIN: hypothetical protein V2J09_001053 [Rumex salicifolius]
MDSRDSSSLLAASRDGGSGVDDDDVLSLTSSLAREAAMLFQSRKYAECVDVLIQLNQLKDQDPKVLHNIALAKFFRDGCLKNRELIEELINVKNKYKANACASGGEAGLQPCNKNTSGPRGTNSAGHNVSDSSLPYTDEFDSSVTTLNMAIISYHLHDYARAISILEPLFQNIEPINEGTALHVCMLLLDLAVASQDVAKFADVINYVEKAFGFGHTNQTDNGSMGLQPSNLVMKSSSIPPVNMSTVDDLNSDESSATANASDSLSRTLSDESAEYETLLSTLDMGELSRPTNVPCSIDLPRTPSGHFSLVDLKLKLPLYKVHLLFLTRRLKTAKRELKSAMNLARGRDSSSALLLKSQLELARGNYVKAEKLLKACYNQADIGSSVIYHNNVGCIFYQWGKYNTAGVFYKKALLVCSSIQKEKPNEHETISQDKSLLILYNRGLQYLACGNPVLAAQCFQKATLVFYSKPLLWLRIAECCLMALKKGHDDSFNRLLCRPEFKVIVIGEGKWRQLSVEDGLVKKRHMSSTERDGSRLGSDTAPHNLSLSFARQCLWNALELVRRFESKLVKSSLAKSAPEENEPCEAASLKNSNLKQPPGFGDSKASQANTNGDLKMQKSGAHVNAALSSMSDYEDSCRSEHMKIKQSALVALAFVELELGNPLAALIKAGALLEMPECSKMYAFLARVYAAEALCLLHKPKEAAEQLSIYYSGGNADLPFGKEDWEQWKVSKPLDPEESYNLSAEGMQSSVFSKPEDGQGALFVNLASLSAVQGNFDPASRYAAKALSVTPNSREANLMCIYLDLKLGRVQEARDRLRSYNRVTFVSYGSRSKGSS